MIGITVLLFIAYLLWSFEIKIKAPIPAQALGIVSLIMLSMKFIAIYLVLWAMHILGVIK